MTGEKTWSIGELAQSTGSTRRALHHYDDIGLLVPAARTENGYRRYAAQDLERLRRIQTLRGLGLPLHQVRRVLDGEEPKLLELALASRLRRSEQELEAEQARRERLGQALQTLRSSTRPLPNKIIDTLEETLMSPSAQKTISILAYADLQTTHDFLVNAFALRPGGVQHDGDGRAVHAEVYAADGSAIWLHRHAPEHGLTSPRDVNLSTGGVVVLVDDVDQHHNHAQSAGAQIDYPPTDQDYGLREYGARDPEGGRWYFAKEL